MTGQLKICVVTGSRAEYGVLYWLLREIREDQDLTLQLVATGMHLSPEFGSTYSQIEADGFTIDRKVEMLLSSDSSSGISKSVGLGVIGFADVFAELSPDIVVLLGDRFEILAAAQAALFARIPIAHIHGGETTEGAFDEQIRHALTKMSQYHFVAAEPYRKRVIQMGEAPERVFLHGAPQLDHLSNLEWLDRMQLEDSLSMALGTPLFLVTYHPVTLGDVPAESAMDELLAALDRFEDATVVFTYPNADTGGRPIMERIEGWTERNTHRAKAFISLGQQRYLSLMRLADVVIGNSSSGLSEAPALKRATVNIGDRQHGRLKASSVIDADEKRDEIAAAVTRAISADFRAGLAETKSLYSADGVSRKIKDSLKAVTLETRKTFFDIQHGY